MTRGVLLLMLTAITLVTVSGCIGGGGTPPPPIDEAAIKAAIGAVIDDFEEAVEQYDVDGMLSCLSGPGFTLTQVEATVTPPVTQTKAYEVLSAELVADEDRQLAWRKLPGEGGYGYVLDLQLGERVFSGITATGAHVTQTFSVVESASGIDAKTTDQGTIAWQFAKISGAWKATSMTITFQKVSTDRAATASVRAAAAERGGFGFGTGLGLPR